MIFWAFKNNVIPWASRLLSQSRFSHGKSWHSVNTQYKYIIPKVPTPAHTLWEDNICLNHGLVTYFFHETCITTTNSVFSMISLSAHKKLEIFILLQYHMKWHYIIWSHTKIYIIGMCCELGNSIEAHFFWLDPHMWSIFSFLGYSH